MACAAEVPPEKTPLAATAELAAAMPRKSRLDVVMVSDTRSALPMGAADHAAEISPHEVGILVGQNIGLHIAEGSFRLVFDPL